MTTLRTVILLLIALATPARSDADRRPPINIAKLATVNGVKVNYRIDGEVCRISIQLDAGNEFMGANDGTVAQLQLKDEAGLLVGSVAVRNRLDFPDGAMLGPVDGTSLGPSLFIEFSCRTAFLKHSVIGFSNRIALRQPSQVVTLRDLLEIKELEQGPQEKHKPNKTSLLTPDLPPVPTLMAATTSIRSRNLAPGQA